MSKKIQKHCDEHKSSLKSKYEGNKRDNIAAANPKPTQ